MFIRLLLLAVIFFPLTLLAQIDTADVSIIKGNSVESKKRDNFYVFSGLDNSGECFLIVYEKYKPSILVHYDSLMNKVNSIELKFQYKDKTLQYEQAIVLKDVLYLLTSYVDDSRKKVDIYVQTINKQTLKQNEDIKKIGEIDFLGEGSSLIDYSNLSVRITEDESTILVSNNIYYYFNNTISIFAFDSKFELLWNNSIKINFGKDEVESHIISRTGDVYFIIKSSDENKIKQSGENLKAIHYAYAFFEKGTIIKEFPLFIPTKEITGLTFDLDYDDNLICAGFCKKNKTSSLWASFFFKINSKSKSLTTTKYNEFDINLFLTKCSDDEVQKVKKQLEEEKSFGRYDAFGVRMTISSSGNVFLIGEYYGTGNNTSYYNEMLVFNYSNEGHLNWSKRIPKHQQTNGYGLYSSYYAFCIKDNFYITFNDNVSNVNLKPCETPSIFTLRAEFMLTLLSFDDTGSYTRKYLLSGDIKDVWMQPSTFMKLKSSKVLMLGECYENQSYKVFKMNF